MSLDATSPHPALAVCGSGLDGTAFSVAVRTQQGICSLASPPGQRGDLAVLARDCLARAGVAAQDLAEVRVDRGPGSYIGLRVAVTFARFTAAFAGARLATADSLALAATAALPTARARRLVPVLDGRQGRLQLGAFAPGPGLLRTDEPARIATDADLAQLLREGDLVLAAPALTARLADLVARARAELAPMPPVSAAALFAAELATTTIEPLALEPVYLTGSYVG